MSVTTSDAPLKQLRIRLGVLYNDRGSWRKVAALKEFENKIAPGTLCSIAKGGYEPKNLEIRKLLGLSIIVTQHKDPLTGMFIKKGK